MGNRKTGPQPADSYTYNAGNEQLTYSSKRLLSSINELKEYDSNGNLIKTTQTEGKLQTITYYAYDDENRLIHITLQKGNKTKEIRFAYDPFGRRISKTLEKDDFTLSLLKEPNYPQITYYLYDEQNIIAEYDQNNKQTATYIHGPNIDEPLAAEIRNTRIYYHADGLGSITVLTNHMGMPIQRYDYDAFGNLQCNPFPQWIRQPYTYTGREYDPETGLYYYRARYYDAKAGRFITRDPIGFEGGINLYNYVSANPVNNVDPSGLNVNICFYPDAAAGYGHVGYGLSGENTTFGFYPTGNPLNSPGEIRTDSQEKKECKIIESPPEKDQCMKNCRTRRQRNPGKYKLFSRQCTSYVRECLKECGLPAGKSNSNQPFEFFYFLNK